MSREVYAVVLAGGVGTRFWPASRRALPKQYLPIVSAPPGAPGAPGSPGSPGAPGANREADSGRALGGSLLADTVARLEGLVPLERVLVVTGEEQVELVRTALPDLPHENVLAEPHGRNTAASIAWAAYEVGRRRPDAVQIVLPADHVIRPAEEFRSALRAAIDTAAADDVLVTFGVRPTHAATGFGYIEAGDALDEAQGFDVHAVRRFVEKPDAERARQFLASGNFLWNSGMFAWSTRAFRTALERHLPEAWNALERLHAGEAFAEVWTDFPKVPVDVGVLERADNVRVIPIDFFWSDVGSWSALPEVLAPDGDGNVRSGGTDLVTRDARDCIVYGEPETLTALIGVEGLVVVRAGDAVLVCPKERAQEVRAIVDLLAGSPERDRFR